jgi:hypothetical protein
MKDDGKCADYAVCFVCNCGVEDAGYHLWQAGRDLDHDGTTDQEIAAAVRSLGFRMRRVYPDGKTVRTLMRSLRGSGVYLVTTTDHVFAVVDGRRCDEPQWGDLLRIEKVHKILLDSDA